jgi:hypothetical protein
MSLDGLCLDIRSRCVSEAVITEMLEDFGYGDDIIYMHGGEVKLQEMLGTRPTLVILDDYASVKIGGVTCRATLEPDEFEARLEELPPGIPTLAITGWPTGPIATSPRDEIRVIRAVQVGTEVFTTALNDLLS